MFGVVIEAQHFDPAYWTNGLTLNVPGVTVLGWDLSLAAVIYPSV